MTGVEQATARTAHGAPVPRGIPEQRGTEHSRGDHTHGEPPAPRPRGTVTRSSVRGQVLDALRAALLCGDLAPGGVYSAPALGERFGVSATPVREAMQQLAREGAVEVVPNRGFRVTERTTRDLEELGEVRALVEVPVVLRLARTLAPARWADLVPLADAAGRAAASGDRARYAEADRAFHRALLSLAGNDQLVRVADDLHHRAGCPTTDLLADAAQHTALLEALAAQDLPAVQAIAREHVGGA
ncbi:GntR family transcriptional regulator [Streptomyces beihaiensis]